MSRVGRVLAGAVAVVAATVLPLAAWTAGASRFGPADRDPHGFGLILGAVLAIAAAVVLAAAAPLAVPAGQRPRVQVLGASLLVVVVVLVVAAVLTA